MESLDEFPSALRDDTVYPWDAPEPVLWPFGPRSGEPLTNFSSRALVRMRGEVERKNGKLGHYWDRLLQEIDRVLYAREGL